MTDQRDRILLTVLIVAAGAVVASITTATILGGDISGDLWFLLVPVGMLGGGIVAVVALVLLLARRMRQSTSG